jgi:putative PEP-CTERM system TPR-repeat lipoprotein
VRVILPGFHLRDRDERSGMQRWLHGKSPRLATAARIGALAAALALGGCFGPSDAELISSARALMGKKDYAAAQLQLKTLLQKKPDSAEGRYLLGQAMYDAGDLAGAEAELRRALELGQAENDVLPMLAGAMIGLGKGALLLQQFGKVSLSDTQADAALKTHLAAAEAGEGNLDGGDTLVAQALQASPDYAPALLLRAKLSNARGDAAGALAQVQALLDRQNDNADAWQLKADLLARAQAGDKNADPAPVVAAYQQAIKLKPGNVAAHSALITLYLGRGDTTAAASQWAALQKAAPKHPQTLFLEAVLAEQKGDYKRTRELTQLMLRAAPNNPQLLLLAGQAELKLNALAQAEALLAKAVQAAPKAAAPRRQLAQVQLRSGQADKALITLRPLLETTPPDVEALTLSAQAQLMSGDAAGADASFARAAKLKPDDPRVRTAAALSGLGKGHDAAALAELRSIAASDKGNTADLALISALVRRNDLDGALKAIAALAAKQPDEPLADQLRGRIALQRKDGAAARRAFEQALGKNADYLPALAGLAALDIADKQPAAAKARFQAALQRNPKNTSVMMALAEITARAGGTPEESQQWLNRAISTDPSDATPRLLLIDQLLGSGQLKAALAAAQAADAAIPDNPDLLDRLGRALLTSGEAGQAVTTFSKLTTVAPRSALAQLRLADAQAATKNHSGMVAAVRRAAELAPDLLQVQQAQVNLALLDNQPEQALAVARKVQAQRPDEAVGFGIEGDIEMRSRHWDAAVTALRKALTRKQPGDTAQRLHAALTAAKKPAEASQLAAEWRKSHPDDMAFVLHLGDMAMAGGQAAAAEGLYHEVLARQPENVLALNNLAYVLALQKKPGAVALAEQALKKAPKAAAVMDTLAFALAAEQQLPRAIEVQTQAVAAAPEAHQFRLQLAKLQLQAGNKAGARSELDKLAKLGSAFPRQAEVAELIKATGG